MSQVGNTWQRMMSALRDRFRSGSTDPALLPGVVYPDDLYLVSYPKSGNTWLRFLFANLLRSSSDEVVNFRTANQYVPEVGKHHAEIAAAGRPRIFKSHTSLFVPEYPKVIYLVRDPRDVYVSYYFYLKKRLPADMTLSDFIRTDEHKLCGWSEHIANWSGRGNTLQIRYEEMLDDVLGVMQRALSFWGERHFEPDWIQAAAEASSFGRMREVEDKIGHQVLDDRGTSWETAFMRRGVKGDWKEHLSEGDLDYIYRTDGDTMERLGYHQEKVVESDRGT